MWHNCQWSDSSFYINLFSQTITKVDQMDWSRLNKSKWTELTKLDHNGPNEPNWLKWIEMDRIESKWTIWTEWTKVDRNGPMWLNWPEINQNTTLVWFNRSTSTFRYYINIDNISYITKEMHLEEIQKRREY